MQVTLCDTAGQDFLDPLRRLCYPDSDVFLLCFSVVKPDTFVSIQDKWAPNFKKSSASIVLIGTQADLRTDPRVVSNLLVRNVWFFSNCLLVAFFNSSILCVCVCLGLKANNEKPVSKSDAWDYAASIGAKYIETSSRTNVSAIRVRKCTKNEIILWSCCSTYGSSVFLYVLVFDTSRARCYSVRNADTIKFHFVLRFFNWTIIPLS